MQTISPLELQALITAQPEIPLLDVRTPVEFAEVHVPQAVNTPLGSINSKELLTSGRVHKDRPVYFICLSGRRSKAAAEKFEEDGFVQTVVIEGGTPAWLFANLPVVRSPTKVISLERQVRIVAGALVFIGVILGWLAHPGFFGLAGFVGAGLVFAGVTDFCGMGLLLARMPWNTRPSAFEKHSH